MATKNSFKAALVNMSYYPSARYAARQAAAESGARYMGGSLVEVDECILEVKTNKNGTFAWASEAVCEYV